MTRLGRALLLHMRPPADRRGDERGLCSVCGSVTRFVRNSWVLPAGLRDELGSPRLVDAFVRRETLFCAGCGSNLRVRRIADVLLGHYATEATCLAELVGEDQFARLDLAELNSVGELHRFLLRHPRLVYAEYPAEDLRELSYADGSFDLLLTSDTLEHVPDFRAALRETRRVLRPGGRHVFTVPAVPSRATTVARATTEPDGTVVHVLPPQHHGRGSGPFALLTRDREDFLAYTDFGLDLLEELRRVGFRSEVHFLEGSDPDADAALVFCSVRQPEAASSR